MAKLTVRGITRGYGGEPIIDGFDLQVGAGKALALIGPNGAGKTTLLQTIAGQLEPEAGDVRAGAATLAADRLEFRRILAYVPDNPVLFDDLTLNEHLEFTAAAFGVTAADAAERSEDLLERFGLSHRADELPGTFSRGMRQRAQLCCAFLRPAGVMLIDEPFVGLDPIGMRTLIDLCLERKAEGCAFVVATHVLGAIQRFCDELGVLADGEVMARGTPAKLLAKYKASTVDDLFVALVGDAAYEHSQHGDGAEDGS
ncbi:MAG: ABC transporter ATP-binding protein [Acidimicrobiia bacterium]|nr:ABC transporter ATP-binding protein [Acidimicrobiia bacterium]